MNWFVIISLLLLVLFVWIILFNLFVPSQITSSVDRRTEFYFQRESRDMADIIGRERRGWNMDRPVENLKVSCKQFRNKQTMTSALSS